MRQIEVGKRIKMRRQELNISAAELAKRLSMSKATIHRYENGDIANIKMPVIHSIARELEVSAGWLLGRATDKEIIRTEGAIEKYKNLDVLFVDLVLFFSHMPNLKSHNKQISEADRLDIAKGIDFLSRVILSKYK